LLTARLAYSRLLFQRDARADDRAVAEAGYRAAAESGDEKLCGWAAAQALLAANLPENDPERAELKRTFRRGAEELHIGWLLSED
jgi:hypothetical protein